MTWKVIMKIYIFMLASSYQGHCKHCWSNREDKAIFRNTLQQTNCGMPLDTLVHIPVPEGYDKIVPRAAIAKRCTGLTCDRLDEECVPTSTTTRSMKVEAYSMADPMNKKCYEVNITEHSGCQCRCEKTKDDCGPNQEFHEKMCSCDCSSAFMKYCQKRIQDMPGMVMWDRRTCSCPCNNWRECGSGEVWANDDCRCVPEATNEIGNK